MSAPKLDSLFDRRLVFPDVEAKERLDRLVGIDDQKERLTKMLGLLVNPDGLKSWADRFHPGSQKLVDFLVRRPPLVILAGDVGCGKTELAETIGDAVARQENIDVTLYPVSLAARGEGRVGEMTQLLSLAFDTASDAAVKLKSAAGKSRGAVLLLIDEADAIAQSREESQMHHEDRAGVNAFIRGVDRLARSRVPAATLLCTNRLNALDPAVKRRAADILSFERPDSTQRQSLLEPLLSPIGFSSDEIASIVQATGPQSGREYGFTFSDIVQRLIPAIVLNAYPDNQIRPSDAIALSQSIEPTMPFQDNWK